MGGGRQQDPSPRTRGGAEVAGPGRRAPRGPSGAVLGLQRSAGNAAVARAVQRAADAALDETTGTSRATTTAADPDHRAYAAALRKILEQRKRDLAAERAGIEVAGLSNNRKKAAKAELVRREQRLDRDIEKISRKPSTAREVARWHDLAAVPGDRSGEERVAEPRRTTEQVVKGIGSTSDSKTTYGERGSETVGGRVGLDGIEGTFREVEVVHDDDDLRLTREQTTTAKAGLSGASVTDAEKTVVEHAEGKSTFGSTTSRGVSTQGGLFATRATGSSWEHEDADGNTRGASSSSSQSFGLLEGGKGVKAGQAHEQSRTFANGVEAGTTRSADGSFEVDVVAVRDGGLLVTTRLNLGLGAGGSAKGGEAGKAGTHGSGEMGASGGVELTYRRRMSAAEAARYFGDLHALESGKSPVGRPEFGVLARAKALGAVGEGVGATGALGDARAAAGLRDGEQVGITVKAGVSAGAKAGGQGGGGGRVGGSVSGSAESSRGLTITRKGDHVLVTVSVSGEAAVAAGLTGGSALVTGSVKGDQKWSSGLSVAFKLDPAAKTYEHDFARVADLMADPASLATAAASLVDSQTTSSGEGSSSTAGISAVFGASVTTGNEYTGEVESKDGGRQVSGSFTGASTRGAEGTVAGLTFAKHQTKTSLKADADAAGITIDLTHAQSSGDVGRALSDLLRSADGKRGEDVAVDALTGIGSLKGVLTKTYARLTVYGISPEHVALLVERAGDERTWMKAAADVEVRALWSGLREVLVDPSAVAQGYAAEHPGAPAAALANLARADALARFAQMSGPDGLHALTYVLRRWGERWGGHSDAADLGTLAEWPPALDATRARYEHATALAAELPGLQGGPAATAKASDAALGLWRVEQEVRDCTDFVQPRAKIEMLDRILAARRGVAEQATRLGVGGLAGGGADGGAELQRFQHHRKLLGDMKAEERRLLETARGMLPRSAGGTKEYGFFSGPEPLEAMALLRRLEDLHELWVREALALRSLHEKRGDPTDTWLVKADASAAPRPLDPDITSAAELYLAASNARPIGASPGDLARVASWKRRAAY